MRIIPVIDLLGGVAVRAVGGRRSEYRPLTGSRLTPSCDPATVASALRRCVGHAGMYLADLDALGGRTPAFGLYTGLAAAGHDLMIDAGVRSAAEARAVADAGAAAVVAGLETVPTPAALAGILAALGPQRVVFSVDLRAGRPLGDRAAWGADPDAIAEMACSLGVRRLLFLDLTRVGTGAGVGTEPLLRRLRAHAGPGAEILVGGGVADRGALDRLAGAGADGVLVATALHDGRLP